jgi:hypothetical protein
MLTSAVCMYAYGVTLSRTCHRQRHVVDKKKCAGIITGTNLA